MKKLTAFFGIWAVAASIALAWVIGRNSAPQTAAPVTAPKEAQPIAQSSVKPLPVVVAEPSPTPAPTYPQFSSTVPRAFWGNWDEMIADKCFGRESRFYFGDRQFNNFEVTWEVTKVKLYSPTEMDLSTTMQGDDGSQIDQVWQFKLVDGGRTLTGRREGATFYKRCLGT